MFFAPGSSELGAFAFCPPVSAAVDGITLHSIGRQKLHHDRGCRPSLPEPVGAVGRDHRHRARAAGLAGEPREQVPDEHARAVAARQESPVEQRSSSGAGARHHQPELALGELG